MVSTVDLKPGFGFQLSFCQMFWHYHMRTGRLDELSNQNKHSKKNMLDTMTGINANKDLITQLLS